MNCEVKLRHVLLAIKSEPDFSGFEQDVGADRSFSRGWTGPQDMTTATKHES